MNIDRSPVGAEALSIGLSDDGSSFSENRRTPGRVQLFAAPATPALRSLAQAHNESRAISAAAHLRMRRHCTRLRKSPLVASQIAFAQGVDVRLFGLPQSVQRVHLIR